MTSKEELLINQLSNEQQKVLSLTRQNKELLAIVEDYKSIVATSEVNFSAMTEQRDQLLQLAKSLDTDFNQGKIFSK